MLAESRIVRYSIEQRSAAGLLLQPAKDCCRTPPGGRRSRLTSAGREPQPAGLPIHGRRLHMATTRVAPPT